MRLFSPSLSRSLLGFPLSTRDVDCYYSTVPVFDGYKHLIGSTMSVAVEYRDASIVINTVENDSQSANGCKVITPTEPPTEAPEDPSGS